VSYRRSQILGTDLSVFFANHEDMVVIHRSTDFARGRTEIGMALRLTMAEWRELVAQAKHLRGRSEIATWDAEPAVVLCTNERCPAFGIYNHPAHLPHSLR